MDVYLLLDDAVVGQTQVGQGIVSELQSTFVELRHRFIHVHDHLLLVNLTDHLEGE